MTLASENAFLDYSRGDSKEQVRVQNLIEISTGNIQRADSIDDAQSTPIPIYPIDHQAIQSDEPLVVKFYSAEGAESYRVQYFNKDQKKWIFGLTGPAVCINGICDFELATFPNSVGATAWRVRALRNDSDKTIVSNWSGAAFFKLVDFRAAASRFVQMADFDVNEDDINQIRTEGPEAWLDSQLDTVNSNLTRYEWMEQTPSNNLHYLAFNRSVWQRLFSANSGVLERWTLALSEIFVINVKQTAVGGLRGFGGAAYLDMLEAHSLGTYRNLLKNVTLSHQMGSYLSLLGSQKPDGSGREPDENYAREIMQLFSIGLRRLKLNGIPLLDSDGNEIETYDNSDVTTLAAALTGWDADFQGTLPRLSKEHYKRPMRMLPELHQTGDLGKLFGTRIDNSSGESALESVLDIITNHPNVGPFLAEQFIKRMVTSNPSSQYVARVARVFNDDGFGVRGNLRAVLKSILLDKEALDISFSVNYPAYPGRIREPLLRFIQWGRTFNLTDATELWSLPNLSNPASMLAQSPLYSPSVFNYFRPGYVPPNTNLGMLNLTSPEMQITSEVSVTGYANFMYKIIQGGYKDLIPDYSVEIELANDPQKLVQRLNLILAANQLGPEIVEHIVTTLESMLGRTDSQKKRRVYAAIFMVMVSPDYLVLR